MCFFVCNCWQNMFKYCMRLFMTNSIKNIMTHALMPIVKRLLECWWSGMNILKNILLA